MSDKKALIKIGAVWEKKTKTGDSFFSGKFGDADLVIFKNKSKKNDRSPDFIIYVQEPYRKEEATQPYQADFGEMPGFDKNEEVPF